MSFIEDGTGKGYIAKVNTKNRLHVQSVVTSALAQAGVDGAAWTMPNTTTLTSANPSAVAYIKNTGTTAMVFRDLTLMFNKSNESTGTPNPLQTIKIEIKGGIVTENLPNTLIQIPLRPSKAQTISITAKGGIEGSAVTAGVTISTYYVQCGSTPHIIAAGEGYFFLEPASTLAVVLTPPAGNTNLLCSSVVAIFIPDETL